MKLRQTQSNEYHLTEELVYDVFKNTTFSDGKLEKELVKEIRDKEYYVPQLDLVVEKDHSIVGHCMLSRMPLNGKDNYHLLMLSPVSVATDAQSQGVGQFMINRAIGLATVIGFKGIIVEGDPNYYQQFGFQTSTEIGIQASQNNLPPAPENLMAMELTRGSLKDVTGHVDYSIYHTLS